MLILASRAAVGQPVDPVPGLLAQLAGPTVQGRYVAFYALLRIAPIQSTSVGPDAIPAQVVSLLSAYPADAPQIVSGLNVLLITETADTTLGSLTNSAEDETGGDFYGDVVDAVASLSNSSAIPALIGAIATGAMATNALAGFGPASLDSVLPLIYSSNVQLRDAAAFTLMTMLNQQFSPLVRDPTSQSKIRAGLKLAVASFAPPSLYAYLQAPYQSTLTSMGPSIPGDLNGDGLVNCADLAIVKASFGKKVGQAGFDIRADVNGDGVVNILDLSAEARLMPAGTVCN
jgi:Dockerin type I domain